MGDCLESKVIRFAGAWGFLGKDGGDSNIFTKVDLSVPLGGKGHKTV